MIKKMTIQKIKTIIISFITLILVSMFPNENKLVLKEQLEYISKDENNIFLIDKNEKVALTKTHITSTKEIDKVKEIIGIMTQNNETEKIPNGFKQIIPEGTKILSIELKEKLLKINFSKDFLEVAKNEEEKLIESIIYNLTEIEGIEKIIIYIEGEILNKLPKTNKILPSTLDRSYGINKKYDFTNEDKINKVTIYYIEDNNKKNYYVPVTLYTNDNREKVEIVIDELSNNNSEYKSYLNTNTKIVSTSQKDNIFNIDFNSYIFDDFSTKQILEETMYTINASIKDNYNVKEVVLTYKNQKIKSP